MYKTVLALSLSAALSGCAGGKFVSSGSVDYVKLFEALSCEVRDVFRNHPYIDEERENVLSIPDNWVAYIDVVIDGVLNRNSGVNASVGGYSIGRSDTIGGSATVSHSVGDTGVITLSRELNRENAEKQQCYVNSPIRYDVSELGLVEWFRSIERNSAGSRSAKLLDSLEYTRLAVISLGPNSVTLSLLPTVKIAPTLGFTLSEKVKVAILFKTKPTPGDGSVKIADESLVKLAKLIRGESVALRSGSSRPSSQDLDSTVDQRELRRDIERLNENTTDLLRRQLFSQ